MYTPVVIYYKIYILNNYLIIYTYIYNKTVAQLAKASDTKAVRHDVQASSGPLINFIKWVLKYYLEVILCNCVYINDRLSLTPRMP